MNARRTLLALGALAAACSGASPPAPTPAGVTEPTTETASEPTESEPAAPSVAAEPAPRETECTSPCRGSAPPSLIEELRLVAAQTRGCYERALRADPTLAGRVGVQIALDPLGKVCQIGFSERSIAMDAAFDGCVRAVFQREYPAPEGGCLNAIVPLNFRPKQAEDAGAP